jgi:hypothetical protein
MPLTALPFPTTLRALNDHRPAAVRATPEKPESQALTRRERCFGRRADQGTSPRPAPFFAHPPEATQQEDDGAARSGDPRRHASPWRAVGIRHLQCLRLRKHFNVDDWQDDTFINSFSPYVKCAKCGHVGGGVRPDWRELRGVADNRKR